MIQGGQLMVRHRRSIAAVSIAFFLLHLFIPARQLYAQGRPGVAAQSSRQLAEGLTYLEKRQYTPALNLLEPLAKQGVPQAQTAVGEIYEKGLGVQRNFITADTWYGLAIAQGDTAAAEKRAAMHERIEKRFQEGIEAFRVEDYARAKERWWDLAYQDRHPAAQTNLGVLYAYGLGVQQDDEEARRWYQRAIAQNYLSAQDNLKALEESIKTKQRRAMPQRKDPTPTMAELVWLATFLGLIMTSEMQRVDAGFKAYDDFVYNANFKRFEGTQPRKELRK
jgi:TPR repeat protein